MFNFKVTYTQAGITTSATATRWFDDAKQAKRYAKSITKMGYLPTVARYQADDYNKVEYVWGKALATSLWLAGYQA